ncbi:lytic murein transglycosylase [Streptomyces sp. NPDC050161]|uniref:lytic transglycosylase domain-containing protein n=1 Tax=Streptomyces sp. NPDC050161 TaxID=3365604 RepID=UPI0037A331FE
MKPLLTLSSSLSTLLARRVRQSLCACALAAGLTAASAISPVRVTGPTSADANGARPDAGAQQAQPRGVPDLELPGPTGESRDGAKEKPQEEGKSEGGSEGSTGIPATALDAYKKAERTLSGARPSCHLPWQLVAGIGRVESVHASGYGLRTDGSTADPIRGPRLDGKQFALIRDTDHGRWDGDAEFDRAIGPLQFIPSTWATWGADGNGDGETDPNNLYDAALATGHYLCAGGRDLNRPADLDKAVLSYNNSRAYVNTVREWMRTYQGGKVTTTPDDAPAAPHHPDPREDRTPSTGPARHQPAAHTSAERDRTPGATATRRPAKPVTPSKPTGKPAGKPAKKPDPAPDRPAGGTDHRSVSRLARVGEADLGHRTDGERFARRPQVRALDAHGHTVPHAKVTYRITGTAAAYFPGRTTTVTLATDRRGTATAPTVQAGDRPGHVTVTASTPGKPGPRSTTFTATVRQAPAPVPDRLELLTTEPLHALTDSRFPEPLRIRATDHGTPTPGVRLTATVLHHTEDTEERTEQPPQASTYGPYFKDEHGEHDEHGDPARTRTLLLDATDTAGRLTLPQLFTDNRPGTYTLRLTTPQGATLDIPLTVDAPATRS